MMGHDGAALNRFADALDHLLLERELGTLRPLDPAVSAQVKAKTWLVCTGDLTTYGDPGRVDGCLKWIAATAAKKGVRHCVIYGNHDVWKGEVPLDTPQADLDAHRSALRAKTFSATWPLCPVPGAAGGAPSGGPGSLVVPLRRSSRELVVTSLNDVLHDRGPNTVAWGGVTADRYWEGGVLDQMDGLAAQARKAEIRVVMMHHPVHDPENTVWMILLNASQVATRLKVEQPSGCRIGTIMLAGHTHQVFPEFDELELPRAHRGTTHDPLGDGQVQLIAGTLSQRPYTGRARRELQHSFSVLRFYEHDDGRVQLEREVWRRGPRQSGPFLPTEDDAGNTAETIWLDIP
jgi:3',5'-cyclic AMP phosphodiesterase CpdA